MTDDIRYFDSLKDDFESFMDDYDVEQRIFLIFNILLKKIPLSGKKVLEVGCGTGRFSERIYREGAQLTIVDIGESLVRNVKHRLGCEGIVADACELPISDQSFDVVISSECIEHTLNPLKAISEMCRVCKTGGMVVITSPNKLWYPVLLLSQWLKIRKFSGIENWIFPLQAKSEMKKNDMNTILIKGCHLWPFQFRFSRPFLKYLDRRSKWLSPLMINFGIIGTKKEYRGGFCERG